MMDAMKAIQEELALSIVSILPSFFLSFFLYVFLSFFLSLFSCF